MDGIHLGGSGLGAAFPVAKGIKRALAPATEEDPALDLLYSQGGAI